MSYITEYSVKLTNPKKYQELRRQNDKLAKGIHVTLGILTEKKAVDQNKFNMQVKVEIQAIHFDKNKFTMQEAQKWLKEYIN